MKYFIITYGCQMNKSDSERIAAILEKSGHKPVKADSSAEALAKADLIVINACSVRQSAMHRVYAKINQIKNLSRAKSREIILAGCVLEADKKKLADKISEFWHPSKYFTWPQREQFSDYVFVPIMTGCNNFCSYCVVPYTRGQEKSRPADKIIKEVKLLIKKGHKEIMLLGQNVNSYKSTIESTSPQLRGGVPKGRRGVDLLYQHHPTISSSSEEGRTKISFAALLRLLNSIPSDFTIKFMTSHPKDMSDELINAIAECKKVSKEIHLPVQSGDNTILKKMNRKYTVARYKKLIKKIRQKIPNATISTDIIVGFPGETKKQFRNTVKLCKEIKFSIAYISRYSPRPGTMAYKLKDGVLIQEKKRRWKILDELVNKKEQVDSPLLLILEE